jgi:hypothetical protein
VGAAALYSRRRARTARGARRALHGKFAPPQKRSGGAAAAAADRHDDERLPSVENPLLQRRRGGGSERSGVAAKKANAKSELSERRRSAAKEGGGEGGGSSGNAGRKKRPAEGDEIGDANSVRGMWKRLEKKNPLRVAPLAAKPAEDISVRYFGTQKLTKDVKAYAKHEEGRKKEVLRVERTSPVKRKSQLTAAAAAAAAADDDPTTGGALPLLPLEAAEPSPVQ